ncbi:GCN5-related N-acetyltransferase [Paenibacillus vortex V453]|jgi:predicted GNAT family acetyltransferase|uniref:GNAT family acetyltransferase n=2 Tax=Paenibacillus TaxID=44249 RepID=A0A163LKP0_9BACL|nr:MULTISPECIES: GNAT family N-acetyltransferase [Paenibacillus]ANA82126.1 GNAT family acetyltransferase [Paenibacillus glucanolyticus]AVV59136.1 N-acetyltransferase [Paenibacillus glucanolyticus]EFU41487.1 GCN5-related N-acetyltransferase [Paenibacillus vortex V453]ETT43572.1 GCN5-like N-acetyltransferase [Paenibacillus sp. FSL R5-808]KZS48210.1 GNAT family acetyltransferase [Paenibacillus glucanolyticus]
MDKQSIQARTGGFFLEDNGKTVAEISYSPQGEGVISIDHTYISPGLRGQGLADELVRKVIDYAREEELKIIPACSYAGHYFDKNLDDRVLLYK